jgi:hypothetical protein
MGTVFPCSSLVGLHSDANTRLLLDIQHYKTLFLRTFAQAVALGCPTRLETLLTLRKLLSAYY